MIETKKKRKGGPGRPDKTDYGSPDAPVSLRVIIPARTKAQLAERGSVRKITPELVERALASESLLDELTGLRDRLET